MNKDSNNFRFGRLKANGSRGSVQTEALSGEVHSSLRHPQPHGFESLPPVGSETYSVYQGGNPDNGAVLIVSGYAPITLSEGDSVQYSAGGATVHCNGASIEIEGATITLNGDSNGGLIEIENLTTKLNALVTKYNAHLATSNNVSFAADPFVATDYENGDVNHG